MVAVAGLTLAAGLGGCSGRAGSPAATAPTTVTLTATPSPTPIGFQGDLRTLLLAVPPTATKTLGPGANPAGTLSIDEIAANATDSTSARAALQKAGFQQGAQAEWTESDKTWVGVFLYQFGSVNAAADYAQNLQASFASDQLFGPAVDIVGIPAGKVFARTTISGNGRWFSEALFARGTIAVELFVTGPVHHGPEKAQGLAQAQYALLPAP